MGADPDHVPIYNDAIPPNARRPYILVCWDRIDPPAGWGLDEITWSMTEASLYLRDGGYALDVESNLREQARNIMRS